MPILTLTFKAKGKEVILWKGKLHRPLLSKLLSQDEAAVRRGALLVHRSC